MICKIRWKVIWVCWVVWLGGAGPEEWVICERESEKQGWTGENEAAGNVGQRTDSELKNRGAQPHQHPDLLAEFRARGVTKSVGGKLAQKKSDFAALSRGYRQDTVNGRERKRFLWKSGVAGTLRKSETFIKQKCSLRIQIKSWPTTTHLDHWVWRSDALASPL